MTASITSSMQTALSGLSAAQRSLAVTANNVSNVGTEGYSRKIAQQGTRVIEGVGTGVQTSDATRIVDTFLNGELRRFEGELGRSSTIADLMDQVQSRIFAPPGEADRGMAARMANLASALESVSNSPESASLRDQAINAVQDMIAQIEDDSNTIQRMRRETDQQIKSTVDAINDDIAALADLNSQFARQIPTAENLDKRDALLRSLSEKIDISTFTQDDNTIAVYTASGQALLEYDANVLIYRPAASVTHNSSFQPLELYFAREIDADTGLPVAGARPSEIVSGGVRSTLTAELTSDAIPDADQEITTTLRRGEISGLLEIRDRYLPELADQIGELATMLRFNLNAAHNDAVPHPMPQNLTGSNDDFASFDAAAGGGTATGEAYLAVVDTDGTVVADITIDIGGAANAAALIAQLNTDLAGFGTAAVNADGQLDISLGTNGAGEPYGMALSEGDSAIQFTDAAGRDWNYGFSHYFGMNDIVASTGSNPNQIALRQDIVGDNSLLSRVVLDHSTGAAVVGGAGDTRGMQKLAEAVETGFTTVDRGGLIGRAGVNLNAYVSDIVGHHAGQTAQAERASESHQSLVDDLANRQGSISGVNLDEELANLVVYQQAYTVAARVITITNELFGELVNIGR